MSSTATEQYQTQNKRSMLQKEPILYRQETNSPETSTTEWPTPTRRVILSSHTDISLVQTPRKLQEQRHLERSTDQHIEFLSKNTDKHSTFEKSSIPASEIDTEFGGNSLARLFAILARPREQRARARKLQVNKIIDLISQLRDGYRPDTEEPIVRTIDAAGFQLLLSRLTIDEGLYDVFHRRLRHTYTSRSKRLSIYYSQMATSFHNKIADQFYHLVQSTLEEREKLDTINSITRLSNEIISFSSGEIITHDESNPLFPDQSFGRVGSLRPSLVFEISWAETSADAKAKAQRYFRETNGEVHTIVHMDIHDIYAQQKAITAKWDRQEERRLANKNSSASTSIAKPEFLDPSTNGLPARFSVWRAAMNKDDDRVIGDKSVHNVDFRNFDRVDRTDGVGLELFLKDFVPRSEYDEAIRESRAAASIYEQKPLIPIPLNVVNDWLKLAISAYRPRWEEDQRRKSEKRLNKVARELETQRRSDAS